MRANLGRLSPHPNPLTTLSPEGRGSRNRPLSEGESEPDLGVDYDCEIVRLPCIPTLRPIVHASTSLKSRGR